MNNHSTKQTLRFALLTGLVLVQAEEIQSAEPRTFPAVLPGQGLAQHDFFYADEAKTRDMYIVRKGKVV